MSTYVKAYNYLYKQHNEKKKKYGQKCFAFGHYLLMPKIKEYSTKNKKVSNKITLNKFKF